MVLPATVCGGLKGCNRARDGRCLQSCQPPLSRRAHLASFRAFSTPSENDSRPLPSVEDGFRLWELVRCRALVIAAISATPFLVPRQAHAWNDNGWLPRRHFRRMKEAREAPSWQAVKPEKRAHSDVPIEQSVSQGLENLSNQVKSIFAPSNESHEFTVREVSPLNRIPGTRAMDARTIAQRPRSMYQPPQGPAATATWLAVAAAVVAGLFFFATKQGSALLKRWLGGKRDGEGGRWIRDRSLGGKLVWIPDKPSGSSAASVSPLASPDDVVAPAPKLRSQATKPQDVAAPTTERPPWWVTLPKFPVPDYVAENARKRAIKLLREMENAKLLGGRDFNMLGLIELQRLCREGNVDLSNKFGAAATRDTMLRVAVQESIKQIASAARGGRAAPDADGSLAPPPRELVCGLAQSIGVPESRAVTIVHAAVAADVRARLLQIAAAMRGGREWEAEAAALGAVVSVFPLTDSSPEAELVGAGLRDKFTTVEMETVLKEMAFKMPAQMSLFAVLLGFDKDVTVPYLAQYVADRLATQS